MKHIVVHHSVVHHSLGTLQDTLGRVASGFQGSIRMALAAAAAVARRPPSASGRSARSAPVSVPVSPKAVDRRHAASRLTTTRWEGQRRSVSWLEGLMLAVVMAYFGGGLVAILFGL